MPTVSRPRDRRIAVLADIHGNLPALEAVIADVERQRVDEILVGGDLVGRGPQGSEVVQRVGDLGWRSIRGNHEDYLLGFVKRTVPAEWWDLDEWSAARWMASELTPEAVRFIEALPEDLLAAADADLHLVHGSPRANNEGIGPWLDDGQVEDHLNRIDESLLVCAHTHRPMVWKVGSGMVVNVGAVGLPFNRDQRAQYAVLTRTDGGWGVEFRQVAYDLDEIFRIYDRTGFLQGGGVTAALLRLELEHALPFLVPFLYWADATGRPRDGSQLQAFLAEYDFSKPIRDFFANLRAKKEGSERS